LYYEHTSIPTNSTGLWVDVVSSRPNPLFLTLRFGASEDYFEGMSKEPLSIEILLQKQKEQREAAAKVTISS